ncbi:MAG TPA: Rieske 2Fe-2S domain-containing protein [Stellaceae bacterium]|nr:Rieske 2Fe-2S domain-containing protein [Stellaceae bacterium]
MAKKIARKKAVPRPVAAKGVAAKAKASKRAATAPTLGAASALAQKLVPVGPKDPAGRIFRRYWIPIEIAGDLSDKPKEIRILGEDLVLFRFPNGEPGLVGAKCAHRNAGMQHGTPEERGLRCCYHGWLYDAAGRCIEMPCEPKDTPLLKQVKLAGYPAVDRYGIIWSYMGEGEPPELPALDVFVRDDGFKRVTKSYHHCNWLQVAENMVDPLHTTFLHRFSPLTNVVNELPSFDKTVDTEFGFVVHSTRQDQGHTRLAHFVFPAMNRVAVNHMDPALEIAWYVTPIDETHALSINARFLPHPAGASDEEIQRRIGMLIKQDSQIPRDNPHVSGSVVFAQDMVAMESQGTISDRRNETLATSDRGVVRLRRGYWDALKAIDQGKEPPGILRNSNRGRIDFTTGIFERPGKMADIARRSGES